MGNGCAYATPVEQTTNRLTVANTIRRSMAFTPPKVSFANDMSLRRYFRFRPLFQLPPAASSSFTAARSRGSD
jgi:hypothetical protein